MKILHKHELLMTAVINIHLKQYAKMSLKGFPSKTTSYETLKGLIIEWTIIGI